MLKSCNGVISTRVPGDPDLADVQIGRQGTVFAPSFLSSALSSAFRTSPTHRFPFTLLVLPLHFRVLLFTCAVYIWEDWSCMRSTFVYQPFFMVLLFSSACAPLVVEIPCSFCFPFTELHCRFLRWLNFIVSASLLRSRLCADVVVKHLL